MSQDINPYQKEVDPLPVSNIQNNELAAKLHELQLSLPDGIEFNHDTLFPKLSGMGHKRDIKTRHKMITKLTPVLWSALFPGEQVQYVAIGTQNKLIEQYFMGALFASLVNKTQFIVTSLRIIMIHLDARGNPKFPVWSVYHNQIATMKKKLMGELLLTLVDGSKYKYGGFKGADKKQMPALVEQARETYRELGFNPTVTQSRENLCCNCYVVVPAKELRCGHCGQEFWKPSQVAIRSLIFPSWGDFIIEHYLIASLELIGYAVSWLFFIMLIAASIAEGTLAETLVLVVALLLLQHVVDAALTYHIAKKGLSPKGDTPPVPTPQAISSQGTEAR